MMDKATGLSMEAPQTLNGTKSNQAANAGRQAAQHRSSCEEREPKLEDSPAPETIGNGTREHEQAGDHKGIRVEDPLQSRQRGMKFVLNGRQRNINNGYIHTNQQQAHAADAEDEIRAIRS